MIKINAKTIIFTLLVSTLLMSTTVILKANAWGGATHEGQAGYAGEYSIPLTDPNRNQEIDILKYNSNIPDRTDLGWDGILIPYTNTPIPISNDIYHSVKHSYLVDVASSDEPFVGDVYENGWITLQLRNGPLVTEWDHAPTNVSVNTELAKKCFENGDTNDGYMYLGYAMHYMSDCSCPVHTTIHGLDYFDSPYKNTNFPLSLWPNVHDAYEGYMAQNWGGGNDDKRSVASKNYEQYIYKPSPDDEYQIDDPETAAKVMACIAYLNYENIRDEMNNNPTGWEDSESVEYSSQWCTEEGMKFDMALIDYSGGNQ